MKTLFTLLLLAGTGAALAQSSPSSTNQAPATTTNAPAPTALAVAETETAPAALEASKSLGTPGNLTRPKTERLPATAGGVAVQAVKMKKPWNLLNPFAPMSDGDGSKNLVPNSAGGPPGINVISCSK